MAHRNARLTVHGRHLLVQRFAAGWPAARVAEQLGVSRATVYKWVHRYHDEGDLGLEDRSSRPHHSPTRTPVEVEQRILALRRASRRGPVFLAGQLGLPASTIGRVLRRHHMPVLAATDPITGLAIRRRHSGIRYERARPGELVHVDVKKLGRVPDGGGWRLHGRREDVRGRSVHGRGLGYDFCTSQSMTTPAWPTSKPTPTNATRPRPGSSAAPSPGSPPTTCWLSGC